MSERHRIIGAAMLILRDGEHVLLSLRKNTGYRDGDYGLVSGHLEQGETFLQGAIREAHEHVRIVGRDLERPNGGTRIRKIPRVGDDASEEGRRHVSVDS